MAISNTSPSTSYSMYGVSPRSILKDASGTGPTGPSVTGVWKRVCFDDVHIREYGFILGDNPAVSKGAPLQIDWEYHNEDVIDVDIFEHCREPVRRHRKKIVLSARKRAKILLNAGHTVDEIADMTLQCQNAKKLRVESIKSGGQWELGNLNVNLADFMSGTAEVTGRTLKMVGLEAVARGTGHLVVGTGKVAGDLIVGTGKLGVGIVLGTGKVATDVVVGTGKVAVGTAQVATGAIVGTGKLTGKVVVGTGQFLKNGTEELASGTVRLVNGTWKGIAKAPRRITSIFAPADLIREEALLEHKQHLKHVQAAPASACNSPTNNKKNKQRRNTELNRRGLSPLRDILGGSQNDEDDIMDEQDEIELFMRRLQQMNPDQVKQAIGQRIESYDD